MANATQKVKNTQSGWSAGYQAYVQADAAAQTFYPGAMIGRDSTGYATKYDNDEPMWFDGVFNESAHKEIESGGSDGDSELHVNKPPYFTLTLASLAVTDVGKIAYASDDQTATLSPGVGNALGIIHGRVRGTSGATAQADIMPFVNGVKPSNLARVHAATGAVTLNRYDLNKTHFCPNTAAQTFTLPAVAATQPGDWLRFIKSSADAEIITLDGNASETIDGSTTYAALDANNDCALLVSDGTRWIIASRDVA